MLIGYARVSTPEQSLDSQILTLKEYGCCNIFKDIASGAKKSRPGLEDALKFARSEDTIVVCKLDRMGRSLSHLIQIIEDLSSRGIHFKSINDQIDTTSSTGKMILGIFATLAEYELNLIRERTHAGLIAARARGRAGGRKLKLSEDQSKTLLTLYESKKFSLREISKQMGICEKSIYNYLERIKNS